jgi:hypothetical protein
MCATENVEENLLTRYFSNLEKSDHSDAAVFLIALGIIKPKENPAPTPS